MQKFKTYQQFNESFDISSIFQSAHAAIDPNDLIQLKTLLDKSKFPTKEEFDSAVKYLDIDQNFIFHNPKDILTPFVYWKGPVYYGFHGGLDMESLKMLRTREAIHQMTDYMDKMLSQKKFDEIFTRADKKILIPLFIEMFDSIPDAQKYDIFMELYVRSEYGFGMFPIELIKKCFSLRKLSDEWKDRMKIFKKEVALNDKGLVTIYRGENMKSSKQENAYSWTLSEKTAKFFADRFNSGRGKVIRRDVPEDRILDYINGRGESEVIIFPDKNLALPL